MYTRGGPRPEPGTLNQLLFEAIEKYNKADALQVRVGDQYTPISHATLLDRIRRVSYGLREIGIRRGDRVAIVSENRPEWAIADYACLAARCTDVPIYPTLPAKQVEYCLCDSGAVAVITTLAGLLTTFVGESLTTRLVRQAWPAGFGDAGTEETRT